MLVDPIYELWRKKLLRHHTACVEIKDGIWPAVRLSEGWPVIIHKYI